ncbi:ArsR/SmtB family transcription factor [Streptosporangium vulgare]|uniref:ArsR/SmtB family transcription factor n=1 Tax=Streptosporangium vulgare TaxID=46190 RepID=UPI003CD05876
MHALDVLGDPVRRRILELLADGELAAGEISAVVQEEFGISQPGVSQHLRVLRDNGFATVRAQGTRRLYAVDPRPAAGGGQVARPLPALLEPAPRRPGHRDRAGKAGNAASGRRRTRSPRARAAAAPDPRPAPPRPVLPGPAPSPAPLSDVPSCPLGSLPCRPGRSG